MSNNIRDELARANILISETLSNEELNPHEMAELLIEVQTIILKIRDEVE